MNNESNDAPLEPNPHSGGEPVSPQPNPPAIVPTEEDVDTNADADDDTDDDHASNMANVGLGLAQAQLDEDDEEESQDFMALIPPRVRARVNHCKKLNQKRDTLMEGYLKERAALEQTYQRLCQPLYEERAKVIRGDLDEEIQPTDEAAVDDASKGTEDPTQDEEEDAEAQALVGIPEFWTCAMANIETIEELITERDNECLLFLTNITCTDFESGQGFRLDFEFAPQNPYFTNKRLTKIYDIPNLLLDDEPILRNVTGTTIDWKPNQCLTYTTISKKQRSKGGKRAGQIRTVQRQEKVDSFFHFFCPPSIPNLGDMDEEEADALEEAFDFDYDVAQSFRSHIIPKAVLWFTGEVSAI
jgi:nucleosome assembly protein 1-like 1